MTSLEFRYSVNKISIQALEYIRESRDSRCKKRLSQRKAKA